MCAFLPYNYVNSGVHHSYEYTQRHHQYIEPNNVLITEVGRVYTSQLLIPYIRYLSHWLLVRYINCIIIIIPAKVGQLAKFKVVFLTQSKVTDD